MGTTEVRWWRRGLTLLGAGALFALGAFAGGALARSGEQLADTIPFPWASASESTDPRCERTPAERRAGEEYVILSVSPQGGNCWSSSLADAKPGDLVDVALAWRNHTGAQVDDLTLRAHLDEGLHLVPSSTKWQNASQDEPVPVDNDDLTTAGINIGSYGNGANAWVLFTVQVDDDFEVPCGLSMLGVYGQSRFAEPPANDWQAASLTFNRGC